MLCMYTGGSADKALGATKPVIEGNSSDLLISLLCSHLMYSQHNISFNLFWGLKNLTQQIRSIATHRM